MTQQPTAELQDLITQARTALEGKRIDCPKCSAIAEIDGSAWCADHIGNAVYVPDPQYAPLLALVREKCFRCDGKGYYSVRRTASSAHSCQDCGGDGKPLRISRQGSGYIIRTDWGRDEGALKGAVDYAVDEMESDAFFSDYAGAYTTAFANGIAPDAATLRALLAALEAS